MSNLREAEVEPGAVEGSPRLRARIAGALFLLSVLFAVLGEFVVPGKMGIAAVVIPVACYVAVTLLLYGIFKPVSGSLALLAVICNLVGLGFEALQWQPRGVNAGMIFHGLYCLLIGCLSFRSTFLPRVLGALMAFAGLDWLIYLSSPLAESLSPYNTAFGLLAEGALMLWLLVMGVNAQRWRAQASVAGGRQTQQARKAAGSLAVSG